MAEAIVSVVAEQLIDIIKEQIQNEIHLVRGVDKEILNLSDELKSLRNVLDDAENRRFQDKNINHWLSRLEQTSYEMEDVLDEWNYVLLKLKMADRAPSKHEVCSFIPSSCLCFNKVVVRHDIARKIENVKERLDRILKERDRYNFVVSMPNDFDRLPESWRVQSTSLVNLEKVHGRDIDRDILVGKLTDNDGSLEESGCRTLSIVGMGGLGKTTLAQLVYNHSRVEKFFDLRIWICVSDPFDLAVLSKGILESIKKGSSPNTSQLDVLLRHVKESITGKRFLLVLDDVWTEDHNKWEPLENCLGYGGAGSKILVTTRNERVVRMMGSGINGIYRLGQLSNEVCWLLLSHMALSGRNGVEFEEIGKKIVQKCNGLPLAAKTLGSLLRFKSNLDEWENLLSSEIWEMEEAKVDIFPHLLLSYNELSPTLKRCFSYCAVFPKDFEIHVASLIENWMALGYLGSSVGDMELKGREYFNALAMRSFFQDFQVDPLNKKISSCKMHDVVHDLAQFLRKNGRMEGTRMNKKACQACDPLLVSTVNEYCSLFWNEEEFPPTRCDCLTRLRLLSMNRCYLQGVPKGLENLIHLRWLDLSGNTLSHDNLKIIFQLYYLQTLILSVCNIEEIPNELGNLIHLRHLDLSYNRSLKELPCEIGNLIHLRRLNLNWNESLEKLPLEIGNLIYLKHLYLNGNLSLKELPSEIGNLIHLRYLSLCDNESLKELPESICNLHELRILLIRNSKNLSSNIPQGLAQVTGVRTFGDFYGGCGWSKLGLLKKLNHLSGLQRLFVRIVDEEVVEDAREAELRNKIHIQQLVIKFVDEMDANEELSLSSSLSSSFDRVRMDVIDALEPHPNLQELCILEYKGLKLPSSWMVSPLNQLKFIQLGKFNRLSSLPPLGKLPCLEVVQVYQMDELEFVGREFLGITEIASNATIAFPKLKKLIFRECPKWKEWEDITSEEEEENSAIMSCLIELTIVNCSSLTTLPRSLLSKATALEKLYVSGSVELQQHCRDINGLVIY